MHTLTKSPKLFKLAFSKEIFDVTYSHQMKAGGAVLSFATQPWDLARFELRCHQVLAYLPADCSFRDVAKKVTKGIALDFFTPRSVLKCDAKISGVYFERPSRNPKHVPAAFSNPTATIQSQQHVRWSFTVCWVNK